MIERLSSLHFELDTREKHPGLRFQLHVQNVEVDDIL